MDPTFTSLVEKTHQILTYALTHLGSDYVISGLWHPKIYESTSLDSHHQTIKGESRGSISSYDFRPLFPWTTSILLKEPANIFIAEDNQALPFHLSNERPEMN